ncbi:hypothetical protein Desru_0512 [Desulforamulus ruminis DSM 2154]|uniref:Uncharacterized protein n=1 Tax=Desulforamulus ruminis (strain ATCC 23193 / DSM 2154 / NCIMB 8452 / DL) TaxID=696281 RepID=F6DS36_DESRL|nr:hypothetical protein Desru_0512 [Desulforamulus ruminis DSM 2154]
MVLKLLQAYKGQQVVIELLNGQKLSGNVADMDTLYLRLETDEGVGMVNISSIAVFWEPLNSSSSQADQLRAGEYPKDQNPIGIVGPGYGQQAQPCNFPFQYHHPGYAYFHNK